jgi:hypothetical protein
MGMMKVLGIHIFFERTMLASEQFIQKLATEYGKHPVRTAASGAWYLQSCKFLRLDHQAF